MFNVTVIRLKDIAKIIAIVSCIYLFGNFIFGNFSMRSLLNYNININTDEIIRLGFTTESCIFKGVLEEDVERTEEVEADFKDLSTKSILNIGSNIFKIKGQEQKIGQNSEKTNENTSDTNMNSEEQKIAQIQDINSDATTQVVTQNPIAEKYNKEYNGIKIKNETSYELTDEMLNPSNLNINQKDIIIFHTHTCESYTQTENYQYEPSRKL